ncbi:MAG: hypothetical protein Q8O83_02160, partial [bacterium]|nr:hypothetical protein [bacterium]
FFYRDYFVLPAPHTTNSILDTFPSTYAIRAVRQRESIEESNFLKGLFPARSFARHERHYKICCAPFVVRSRGYTIVAGDYLHLFLYVYRDRYRS